MANSTVLVVTTATQNDNVTRRPIILLCSAIELNVYNIAPVWTWRANIVVYNTGARITVKMYIPFITLHLQSNTKQNFDFLYSYTHCKNIYFPLLSFSFISEIVNFDNWLKQ